ncbi:response regulator, partial [Acidobacteriota bacterium]
MSVKSVLVIDDDAAVREHFKRCLRTAKIKVTLAFNAKYGIEELERSTFDCVFCDVRMPIISGEEVLDHVREHYTTTPVVMMTEYGKPDAAVEIIKRGAFDYQTKPIAKETIIACEIFIPNKHGY